ncbi:MAG: sulfotransferase family protein [Verrucomicrobiota bacterium]|nr:sulfotransferase family protein [Verrucomicrobiota bacterium]
MGLGSRKQQLPRESVTAMMKRMEQRALIFLHIPKTAGTTLNRIIEWQYNPLSIFTMDPYRIRATPERLKQLPEARRRRLRMVRGHFYYGVHEYLPQGATYITMLREPVARFLSAYYFLQRRPLHPMHRKVKSERVGVEDFIRLTPQRQNLQCSLIAGIKSNGKCEESTLEIAKENLVKSFSIVGLSERFEESLVLIAKTFDWQIPFYENRKVSKTRPKIEPSAVDMIKEHNRLDLELYEFGKGLFEASLAKKQSEVTEGLAELRSVSKPTTIESFYKSTVGAGRFLMTKIASAV